MGLLGSEDAGVGSIPTAAGPDSPGVTPPDVDYLNAIYTAGLGDPATHNVFPMATGNLRFWGSVTSGSFPNAAFFESSSTPGDGRVPAWYTSRYYNTAIGIGVATGDAFVGFDPAWAGSFAALNSFAFVTEEYRFTSATDQSVNPNGPTVVDLGQLSWLTTSGFFNGPTTYPTPGNNPGGRTNWQLYSYNSHDAGLGTQLAKRHAFNSWGQHIGYPEPIAAGITAAYYSAATWTEAPATIGNGIGWFIGNGQGDPLPDPPKAIYEAHMLTTTPNGGGWGLGFWVSAANGAITKIATLDWTDGLTINAGNTVPGATAVTITNSPGASAAPVEYLSIKTASGRRYIPLLA